MVYQGTIVGESLVDERVLNRFKVEGFRVTDQENPEERWHMYKVRADEETILDLANYLKPKKWYAHFWNNDEVIAVFAGKTFRLIHSKKETWREAVEYGVGVGISLEQLDFVIE